MNTSHIHLRQKPFASLRKSITIPSHETARKSGQVALKPIIYWSIISIALLACIWVKFEQPPAANPPLKLTSMLDVEPNRFYYVDNKFHVDLRSTSHMKIDIELADTELTQYNELVLTDYEFSLQSRMSLHWTQQQKAQHITLKNNHLSINPVSFKDADTNPITDMYILIELNPELGTEIEGNQLLSFSGMTLDYNTQQATNDVHEWWTFVPLKFSSINSYTSINQIHTAPLVLRIGVWLTLVAVFYCVMRLPRVHLVTPIILGWLLVGVSYTNNQIKQHQQIQTSFNAGSSLINQTDQTALNLAQRIETALQSTGTTADSRVIIVGPNEFFNLRLYKHLLYRNVALTDIYNLQPEHLQPDYNFVLIDSRMVYCQTPESHPSVFDVRSITYLDTDMCIIQPQ